MAILVTLATIALSVVAPGTEPDALGCVIPLVQRIIETATFDAWPHRVEAISPHG